MQHKIKDNPFLMCRVLRCSMAHKYLGMCKDLFAREIRPYLTEVRIGKQGIGFDRLDLDEVWEHYKSRNGRPPARSLQEAICQKNPPVITSIKSPVATKSTSSLA